MAIHFSIPCLENSMGRGVWRATVHGVKNSGTLLSADTPLFSLHFLSFFPTFQLQHGTCSLKTTPRWECMLPPGFSKDHLQVAMHV